MTENSPLSVDLMGIRRSNRRLKRSLSPGCPPSPVLQLAKAITTVTHISSSFTPQHVQCPTNTLSLETIVQLRVPPYHARAILSALALDIIGDVSARGKEYILDDAAASLARCMPTHTRPSISVVSSNRVSKAARGRRG